MIKDLMKFYSKRIDKNTGRPHNCQKLIRKQILEFNYYEEYDRHIKVGDIVYIYNGTLYPEKPYVEGKKKSRISKKKSTKGKKNSTKGKKKSTKGKKT